MQDPVHYGAMIQADPSTLPGIYRAWREDHPGDPVSAFAAWVERGTGQKLVDLLRDVDAEGLLAFLGAPGGDSPGGPVQAEMVLEGLEGGP